MTQHFHGPGGKGRLIAALLMMMSFPGHDFVWGQPPEGAELTTYAGESLLANPVALSVDLETGATWVAEAHRKMTGVWGVTFSRWWSMEDYTHRTLQQRREMYERWAHVVPLEKMTSTGDVLRFIPASGDGGKKADQSSVWGQRFSDSVDGNAAGVLSWNGTTWFACIPYLYRSSQKSSPMDGDFEVVAGDFGVRVGVHGHDLHGIVPGPDGRIYFSIGDRGFDVTNADGQRFHQPHRGGVFRCEPDGSGLELFHEGLRNPQELAFNWRGDLFTVDNNMSGGDECRVIQILEGADSGWDATYQLARNFRDETGKQNDPTNPWFFEHLWQTNHVDQPLWVHRPVSHLTRGPSGLTYVPGDIAPPEWQDTFLISDFVGSPASSFILSFKVKPEGAGYAMTQSKTFLKGVLSTDQTFGPDGALYIADFINGWTGLGQGKIRRLEFPSWSRTAEAQLAIVARSRWVPGDNESPSRFLAGKLHANDWDARLLAQWKLADMGRDGLEAFREILNNPNSSEQARIHALWGTGIQQRRSPELRPDATSLLLQQLETADGELLVQAAALAGQIDSTEVRDRLLSLLKMPSKRLQYHALLSLSRQTSTPLSPESLDSVMAWAVDAPTVEDHNLRHALTTFMHRRLTPRQLAGLNQVNSHGIRLSAVLALRRSGSSLIELFLDDPSVNIRMEAARAVHDLRIREALYALAAKINADDFLQQPVAWQRRVLNANFLIPGPSTLENIIRLALSDETPDELAAEAAELVTEWESPSPFDNVTWHAWDTKPRRLPDIGETLSRVVREKTMKVVSTTGSSQTDIGLYDILTIALATKSVGADVCAQIASSTGIPQKIRNRAVQSLLQMEMNAEAMAGMRLPREIATLVDVSLALKGSPTMGPESRVFQRPWLMEDDQVRNSVIDLLEKGETANEKVIGKFLLAAMDEAMRGSVTVPWHLRVADLASGSVAPAVRQRLADWEESLGGFEPPLSGMWKLALDGGDAERGRWLFMNHSAQCIRCHKIDDAGGEAGPDLTSVLAGKSPESLLQSILNPSAEISPGYGIADVNTRRGNAWSGRYLGLSSDGKRVLLEVADEFGRTSTMAFPQDAIQSMKYQTSAMPVMMDQLKISETADLIAYLRTLK